MIAKLDLRWSIRHIGWIPLDHAYPLFAAIACLVPEIHGNGHVGIHRIQGIRTAPGRLELSKNSSVTVRTPTDLLPSLMALSGKKLQLAGSSIRLGVPTLRAISPASTLYSQVVTIKGFQDTERFIAAAQGQVAHLGISAMACLQMGQRRVVAVKGNTIVGFALKVAGLTDEESLRIQVDGIGGRRRFGCGLFVPVPLGTSRGNDGRIHDQSA